MATHKLIIFLCGAIGLILDVIGVIILYYDRDRSLQKISKEINIRKIHVNKESELRMRQDPTVGLRNDMRRTIDNINNVFDNNIQEMNDVISELNAIIDVTEKSNNEKIAISQRWLWLIIVGFALQFLATCLNWAWG